MAVKQEGGGQYPLRIPQPGGHVMVYIAPGCGYMEDPDGNRVVGTFITETPAILGKRKAPRYKSPHRRNGVSGN